MTRCGLGVSDAGTVPGGGLALFAGGWDWAAGGGRVISAGGSFEVSFALLWVEDCGSAAAVWVVAGGSDGVAGTGFAATEGNGSTAVGSGGVGGGDARGFAAMTTGGAAGSGGGVSRPLWGSSGGFP